MARKHLNRNFIGIETLPRKDVYQWNKIVCRKEKLANELDGNWFIHISADKTRVPTTKNLTLTVTEHLLVQQ